MEWISNLKYWLIHIESWQTRWFTKYPFRVKIKSFLFAIKRGCFNKYWFMAFKDYYESSLISADIMTGCNYPQFEKHIVTYRLFNLINFKIVSKKPINSKNK